MSGWVLTPKADTPQQDSLYKRTIWEHSELQMEIETPVLLAHAIEDSTDIFGIWGGGEFEPLKPPLPRYVTVRGDNVQDNVDGRLELG